jgi:transposase
VGKIYSEDLRWRVVNAKKEGMKINEIAERFLVGIKTVNNWWKIYKETGDVKPGKRGHTGYGHKVPDLEKFREFIEDNPNMTHEELGKLWGCGRQTICNHLKKIGYTYKKRHGTTPKRTVKNKENF